MRREAKDDELVQLLIKEKEIGMLHGKWGNE